MKSSITAFAAALLAALGSVSCQKINQSNNSQEPKGQCALTVSINDIALTKVSGDQSSGDVTIKNAQVFIFETRKNQIDNAEYKTFSSTTQSCSMSALSCSFGSKVVWAIVNAPKDYVGTGVVRRIEDLEALAVKLSDNTAAHNKSIGRVI